MDGMMLVEEARAVGLNVAAEGDRLVIRGPKAAASVASRLVAHKREVLAALAIEWQMRPDEEPCDQPQDEEVGRSTADAEWESALARSYSPILYMPPHGCLGPRACSRIGVCDRYAEGRPCAAEEVAS